MNREILFRGKWRANGDWVEGFYTHIENDNRHVIITRDLNTKYGGLYYYTVDPATVGQYTGLTDKNGKRIFEGDVVRLDDTELWVFRFGNCGGVQNVRHEVGYMGFYLEPLSSTAISARDYGMRNDPVYYLNACDLRIVGNIHDNPELTKNTTP